MVVTRQQTLKKALQLYALAGVDEAVSAAPTNWFEASNRKPSVLPMAPVKRLSGTSTPNKERATSDIPARQVEPVPAPQIMEADRANRFADVAPDEAVMQARTRAKDAKDLAQLREIVSGFDGCPLKVTAKQLCFADGAQSARLMFVGEAPGRDEDLQGRPFVGEAGQLLDAMLQAAGISRETDCYITNMVFWRPPGNRNPTPQETQACLPFLERQIELVDPQIIIFLGGVAAKQMLQTTTAITRMRGKWKNYLLGEKKYRAIAMLHPAYLLRTPAGKRLAWRDMLTLRAELDKN